VQEHANILQPGQVKLEFSYFVHGDWHLICNFHPLKSRRKNSQTNAHSLSYWLGPNLNLHSFRDGGSTMLAGRKASLSRLREPNFWPLHWLRMHMTTKLTSITPGFEPCGLSNIFILKQRINCTAITTTLSAELEKQPSALLRCHPMQFLCTDLQI